MAASCNNNKLLPHLSYVLAIDLNNTYYLLFEEKSLRLLFRLGTILRSYFQYTRSPKFSSDGCSLPVRITILLPVLGLETVHAMSFECQECKRTYSSQSSLARHKHNHDTSGEYPCSICNVVFYRADLRARHMNLHKSPASAETASSETPGEASTLKQRRRCHTACIRCRALRIKCSSQRPCDACTATGKSCESVWDSRRVSRARTSPAANAPQMRDETFAQLSPPESSSEVRQGAGAIASTNMDRGPLEGADVGHYNAGSASIGVSQSDPPFYMPRSSDNDHLAEEAPLEPVDFSQQSQQLGSGHDVSWPWVYESLFLPNDEIFSWPQVSPPDAPDAQRNPHKFLLQSRDESLGFLPQIWGDQSTGVAADHVALGHSRSPALNGTGLSSMPSTSMAFSSGGGRDRDGGRRSLCTFTC